jgi:hypothetical protein
MSQVAEIVPNNQPKDDWYRVTAFCFGMPDSDLKFGPDRHMPTSQD